MKEKVEKCPHGRLRGYQCATCLRNIERQFKDYNCYCGICGPSVDWERGFCGLKCQCSCHNDFSTFHRSPDSPEKRKKLLAITNESNEMQRKAIEAMKKVVADYPDIFKRLK